jgi:hypothetical protein
MQKHHLSALLDGGHVPVAQQWQALAELRQLVVVRGKQRAAAQLGIVVDVLDQGLGNRHAVVGAGAAPHFVEDDEAFGGALRQNSGGFGHFDHKRALAGGNVVLGADACENAVDQPDFGAFCWHKRADLGHEYDEGHLAHYGTFAGHVGAGDDANQVCIGRELERVGDEMPAQLLFNHGMPPVFDAQSGVVMHVWAHITIDDRHFGQGGHHVEVGNVAGHR